MRLLVAPSPHTPPAYTCPGNNYIPLLLSQILLLNLQWLGAHLVSSLTIQAEKSSSAILIPPDHEVLSKGTIANITASQIGTQTLGERNSLCLEEYKLKTPFSTLPLQPVSLLVPSSETPLFVLNVNRLKMKNRSICPRGAGSRRLLTSVGMGRKGAHSLTPSSLASVN